MTITLELRRREERARREGRRAEEIAAALVAASLSEPEGDRASYWWSWRVGWVRTHTR